MKFNNNFQLNKKDLEKGLKFPKKMSEELAELIGIHFGDGSMDNKHNYTYKLSYACNIVEKQYANYLINKFQKLFNVSLSKILNQKKSCIILYLYSKTLCKFFNEMLEIPYSPKNNLQISSIILSKKEYLISFIRGLFDTDGCITIQRFDKYKYPLIKISTKYRNFAQSISKALKSLNINSFISTKSGRNFIGYDVTIRNKEAKKFFQIIGSNNSKNIEKWGHWDLNF